MAFKVRVWLLSRQGIPYSLFLPSPSPLTALPLPLPSKRNKYDFIHSPHPLHLIMCIKLSNSHPVSNLIPWQQWQSRERQLIAPRWLPLKLRSNYCCWSCSHLISSYSHQRSSCYRRTSMDRITTIDWWCWVQHFNCTTTVYLFVDLLANCDDDDDTETAAADPPANSTQPTTGLRSSIFVCWQRG